MHNLKIICQLLMVLAVGFSLFLNLKIDVEGRPAKPPKGFSGIVATFIAMSIVTAIYYFAGAFSELHF